MLRELGSDRWDLPHDAKAKPAALGEGCVCGRPMDHDIHQPVLTEKASAVMHREVGS